MEEEKKNQYEWKTKFFEFSSRPILDFFFYTFSYNSQGNVIMLSYIISAKSSSSTSTWECNENGKIAKYQNADDDDDDEEVEKSINPRKKKLSKQKKQFYWILVGNSKKRKKTPDFIARQTTTTWHTPQRTNGGKKEKFMAEMTFIYVKFEQSTMNDNFIVQLLNVAIEIADWNVNSNDSIKFTVH